MILHLSTLFALGITFLEPGDSIDLPIRQGRVEMVALPEAGPAGEVIVTGRVVRKDRTCDFEVVMVGSCILRAKGCGLAGQAPACE